MLLEGNRWLVVFPFLQLFNTSQSMTNTLDNRTFTNRFCRKRRFHQHSIIVGINQSIFQNHEFFGLFSYRTRQPLRTIRRNQIKMPIDWSDIKSTASQNSRFLFDFNGFNSTLTTYNSVGINLELTITLNNPQ